MIRLVFLLVASVFLMGASPDELDYVGHVNDFADILSEEEEQYLEGKLIGYEEITTIEIAVVTTPSLDGYDIADWTNRLGRRWGVGKAGVNNGVVIAIAPNERRWRIEVGYGLEWILTDAQAHDVGEAAFPDRFRAGDWGGGVTAGVEGVINELGTMSPEEQSAMQARLEEEKRLNSARIRGNLFNFFSFVIAVIASIFGFGWLRSLRKKRREEKERLTTLQARYVAIDGALKIATGKYDSLSFKENDNWAVWAKALVEKEFLKAESAKESLSQTLATMPEFSRAELPVLEKVMSRYEEEASHFIDAVTSLSVIPEKIEEYRTETTRLVGKLRENFSSMSETMERLSKAGLIFVSVVTDDGAYGDEVELVAVEKMLLERGVGKADTSDEIQARAAALNERILEVNQLLLQYEEDRKESLAHYRGLDDLLERTEQKIEEYDALLSDMEKRVPSRVLDEYRKPHARADLSAMRTLYDSLDAKDADVRATFLSFATHVRQIEGFFSQVSKDFSVLYELDNRQNAAQEEYNASLKKTKKLLRDAEHEVADTDVELSSRQLYENAKKDRERAVREASSDLVDWIVVASLLNSARTRANESISSAQNDKSRAARRRRREREEASRRSSSSYSSSSSSFGTSSGGFGGFGGGSFGGGGASGGW